ncbi:MAG TPA: Glu/Leu/Phe/Val dehydrogenase dimerization domain-containing protein [Mycobacteriales bacterium]|jgi:valine dehydrogenase (NAD+)|nr:Glu/Leu/Phe/Val dehydrogenase dimerization domain-containing protein [Mycobacteriales bacterium]
MQVFPRTEQHEGQGHEQVVFCYDKPTGLRAIIAIYSTALGPALGGTRFYPYLTEAQALDDVLHLSMGMAYKNALAGLDFGGGKAVIWGDPATTKTEALLRAYGRFVESLGGRYITACDVGTYVEDMDVVARECQYVTGRSPEHGGAGDSSVLTSFGTLQGMRAAAAHRWGSPDLVGKTVGVAGVGKVGRHLVERLIECGARVIASDIDSAVLTRVRERYPAVSIVDPETMIETEMDIYAPCALGGVLSKESAPRLRAAVICGAANNQLTHPDVAETLAERDVLYVPDYVVNAGGVIQVADEIEGFVFERARKRAERIFDTTARILATADEQAITPSMAADRLAERRMAEVGRLRTVLVPQRRG